MEVKIYDTDLNKSAMILPDVDLFSNIVVLSIVLSSVASVEIVLAFAKEEIELAVEKNEFVNKKSFDFYLNYLKKCHSEYEYRFEKKHYLVSLVEELDEFYFPGDSESVPQKVSNIYSALSGYPVKRYYTKRLSPSSVYKPIQGFEFSYKKNTRYWELLAKCIMP